MKSFTAREEEKQDETRSARVDSAMAVGRAGRELLLHPSG
jgi:hypothetical protein